MNCLSFCPRHHNRLISTSYDGSVRAMDLEAQRSVLLFGTDDAFTSYHAQLDPSAFLVTMENQVGLVDTRVSNDKMSK